MIETINLKQLEYKPARINPEAKVLIGPSLPTEAEKMLATLRLNIGDKVEPETYIINVDDVGVFPLSNVSFVKGPSGNGKTVALTVMMSVVLSGKPTWRLSCPPAEKPYKVALIDTEQAPFDTMNSMLLRIQKHTGFSEEEMDERVEVYRFLGLEIEDMKTNLETILKYRGVNVLVIDGLAEFIAEPNEQNESKTLMSWLNNLAQQYNVAIISVIHTNPSDPKGKMNGAFGTYANRRAANVIQVSQDTHSRIFKLESAKSRHKPMPSWSFKYDDNDELVSTDALVAKAQAEADAKKAALDHAKKVKAVEEEYTLACNYLLSHGCKATKAEIANHLKANGITHGTAYRKCDILIDENLIPYDELTSTFYIESTPSDEPEDMWLDDVEEIEETEDEI